MLLRVLLAVGEPALRRRLQQVLADEDVNLRGIRDGENPWPAAVETPCDVLIIDRASIPEPAAQSFTALTERPGAPAVVVVAAKPDTRDQATLRAAGSEAFLDLEVDGETLQGALRRIIDERRDLLSKTVLVRRNIAQPMLADFVSASTGMDAFMKTVRRVVDSDAPLLVMGETGVGKERLARAIHAESRRGDGPFISVNCGAIPENLLESQLFGHEKGAFTGATKPQRGCFELAHGGTLFLDEIGEMPLHLQVKLLHALQDYEVRPIGSERAIRVDVRVIAATNRDIDAEVTGGRFRRDLYFRLSVVSVTVPPLRERREDVPALAASCVDELAKRIGRKISGVSPEAMDRLRAYDWPGNVRELINVLERAVLLCDGDEITTNDLPDAIASRPRELPLPDTAPDAAAPAIPEAWLDRPLQEVRQAAVERAEKAYLEGLLSRTGGKIGETAGLAGIEPRSLFTKMKRYGLRKEEFKPPRT